MTSKRDARIQLTPKHDENPLALSTIPQNDGVVDAKPLAISSGTLRASGSKEPVARLHNLYCINLFLLFHSSLILIWTAYSSCS